MVLQLWEIITIGAMLFIMAISGVVIALVILRKKNWPWFATVLADDPKTNQSVIDYRDKAKLIAVSDGGERIFFLRKKKRFAPDYGKRVGKNAVAFGTDTSGDLYNISFEGMNKRLFQMGIVPAEVSVKLATASVREMVKNRYNTKTFLEKWGVPITIGMLIIAIIIQASGSWWSHHEANKGKAQELEIIKAQKETMELARQVLGNIDNIESGGSGLVPAV